MFNHGLFSSAQLISATLLFLVSWSGWGSNSRSNCSGKDPLPSTRPRAAATISSASQKSIAWSSTKCEMTTATERLPQGQGEQFHAAPPEVSLRVNGDYHSYIALTDGDGWSVCLKQWVRTSSESASCLLQSNAPVSVDPSSAAARAVQLQLPLPDFHSDHHTWQDAYIPVPAFHKSPGAVEIVPLQCNSARPGSAALWANAHQLHLLHFQSKVWAQLQQACAPVLQSHPTRSLWPLNRWYPLGA